MTVREAVRAQREAMKNRTLKENLSFLWDYYGLKAICLLIGLVLLISLIVSVTTQKETAFCGVFFGSSAPSEETEYLRQFADAAGINTARSELTVQTFPDVDLHESITEEIYQYMQLFSAMVSAQMVDIIAADSDLFLYYGYAGYATDLRTVFTAEQLALLAPYVYYIDGEILSLLETQYDSSFQLEEYPDPTKPEDMADPIPVAVSLRAASQSFQDTYGFIPEDVIIGVCANTEHPENVLAFLRYTLSVLPEA